MTKFTRNAILKQTRAFEDDKIYCLVSDSDRAVKAFKKSHPLAHKFEESNIGIHIEIRLDELVNLLRLHKPEAIEVMTPSELFAKYKDTTETDTQE